MMDDQVFRVLLADDSEDDIFLVKRAFRSAGIDVETQVARDGEEAIALLDEGMRQSAQGGPELPALLLLDLKMPRKGGFDVLEWVRAQEQIRRLVVIVFTSSMAQADVDRSYDLGANGFLVKPSEFADLVAMMERLANYWLQDNRWPRISMKPMPS